MKHQSGFTLLEVMIAFAILGLSLTTLYSTYQTALQRSEHDRRLNEATLLAQSTVSRIGTEWPVTPGTSHTQWQDYNIEVNQVYPELNGQSRRISLPVLSVIVTVSWGKGNDGSRISLSTLKLLSNPA